MKGRFVFVVVGGENLRIVPVNITIGTMTGVFGDPRYMFIRFRRGHIIFVLGHASMEGDACLSDVFGLGVIFTELSLSLSYLSMNYEYAKMLENSRLSAMK